MPASQPLPAPDTCTHCGLPVRGHVRPGEAVYCCHGCLLASRIVGVQQGQGARALAVLRASVGAVLAMNVMMVSLLLYEGSAAPKDVGTFHAVLLGLSAPAAAMLLYPFVLGSVADLRRRRLSLDTLVAVGAIAALGVSTASTLRGRGEVYFDTAVMLLLLVTIGRLIEAFAKGRAAGLTRSLESLLPAQATRLVQGQPQTVALRELTEGDLLLVRPGERFPADGAITEGQTLVEQAAFTGEPAPQPRGPGQEVFAGTVNAQDPVVVRAQKVGPGLLLRRIVQAVEQARQDPAPMERLADRLAATFIPIVLVLAASAGGYWLWAAGAEKALMTVLAVLVVACPCAMGIAAPLTNVLAIGRAAALGVVVRGAEVMENLGRAKTIFLDKTGTLTQGRPRVVAVEPAEGVGADELLGLLAAVESRSGHVLARAIVEEARARGLAIPEARDVRELPGLGVRGLVEDIEVHAGSEASLRGTGILPMCSTAVPAVFRGDAGILPACPEGVPPSVWGGGLSQKLQKSDEDAVHREATVSDTGKMPVAHMGKMPMPHAGGTPAGHAARAGSTRPEAGETCIYVSWSGAVRGRVVLADLPREDAAQTVAELRRLGAKTVLISGDSAAAARATADQLGIDEVIAPCLPDEKLRQVTAQSARGVTIMVGDGVNDAPALAAASVGVAIGAGTDLARQAGNVVLVQSRLEQIAEMIRLSRRTRRIIVQNLLWALGYNGVALALAAGGRLHPLLAAVAMAASSITVLVNSARVRKNEVH